MKASKEKKGFETAVAEKRFQNRRNVAGAKRR